MASTHWALKWLDSLIIVNSSGDTGVSASLILHGTPPFQVYYSTQRDKENPRDLVKTFTSSRGELTLQPEHSGHYFYTFLQLSDTNYRKVELNGPSIDQVVHPLAAADFVSAGGRTKRVVNSCSGNMVDIEVDLRVRDSRILGAVKLLNAFLRGPLRGTWSSRSLVFETLIPWKSVTSRHRQREYRCLSQHR